MNIANSSILVTGGAGFIGSHIVYSLLAKGARVTVLDNLSFGTLENLKPVMQDIEFVQGDIMDTKLLAQLMRGKDAVSHHAAQLEILLSTADPFWDLQINTIGTLNVLEAARKAGVGKVINASSACVYGQKTGPTVEDDARHPNWAYGISKLAAEEYCRFYAAGHNLPSVNLRYSIVYGEREWLRRALPLFLKRTIDGLPPVVFGTGDQFRDFIHVSDVVALHDLCLESDRINGSFLNVSSGQGVSIAELARLVSELFHDGTVLFEDLSEGNTSRVVTGKRRNTNELKSMILDATTARETFGWTPQVELAQGLTLERDWALANAHRWVAIPYSDRK